MSKNCRYFIQHAWKQDLCANCFESREEHRKLFDRLNLSLPVSSAKAKSILRDGQRVTDTQRKSVVFPEILSEIIGYGGDDLYDEGNNMNDDGCESSDLESTDGAKEHDFTADSEDDRVLNNLTRANTNFNRITENLMKPVSSSSLTNIDENTVSTKALSSLMLGSTQKDAEGKKKTLLVSVTPFGTDIGTSKSSTTLNCKKLLELQDIRPSIQNNMNISVTGSKEKPQQEKLIDMPLIQSNRSILMVRRTENVNLSLEIPRPNSHTLTTKLKETEQAEEKNCDNSTISNTETSGTKDKIVESDFNERTIEGESIAAEPIDTYDRVSPLQKSREDAGVPDGRADEDEVIEPVARNPPPIYNLKMTPSPDVPPPIPTLPRSSFLHGAMNDNDEISSQQSNNLTSDIKKLTSHNIAPSHHLTVENSKVNNTEQKREAAESEKNMNTECSIVKQNYVPPSEPEFRRRMAPKPPEIPLDDSTSSIFARKPASNIKSDCPVVREKEKRERATTNSPKFRTTVIKSPPQPIQSTGNIQEITETNVTSKRSISLSRFNPTSANSPGGSLSGPIDEDMRKKNKPRFSLRRLLRMGGSRKDMDIIATGSFYECVENVSPTVQLKLRPEIIHPLEHDGAVEVLRHDKLNEKPDDHYSERANSKADDATRLSQNCTARLGKPPPPPRNSHLPKRMDVQTLSSKSTKPSPSLMKNELDTESLASDITDSSWQSTPSHSLTNDSIYANLAAEDVAGEVRSGLTPSKPQRTASIRGVQPQTVMKPPTPLSSRHTVNSGLLSKCENLTFTDKSSSANLDSFDSTSNDNCNVEHGISSSLSQCDITNLESHNINKMCQINLADNNIIFSRSNSFPSCDIGVNGQVELLDGSHTISREKFQETIQDCKNKGEELLRIRQRRGRNLVHRSLEDNYGAVVIANHESLRQLLEQLVQADNQSTIPVDLRILKASNPRLNEFDIDVSSANIIIKRAFYSAMWNDKKVTLCFSSSGLMSLTTHRDTLLVPIAEFVDSIPKNIAENCSNFRINDDVTVSVLRHLKVSTIKSFSDSLINDQQTTENSYRQCCLVLLQFVNALKTHQARGIEEFSRSLIDAVLCREEIDSYYRLYLLQCLYPDTADNKRDDYISLCQCALVVLEDLNLMNKFPVIRELLIRERAVSLSQVKAVLEYTLWGPSDVITGDWKEREIMLQRWLDLERANVLHSLVKMRSSLTVADEYHLTFLVNTTAKIMCEASVLLGEQRNLGGQSSSLQNM